MNKTTPYNNPKPYIYTKQVLNHKQTQTLVNNQINNKLILN